jgi:hypothetical protein
LAEEGVPPDPSGARWEALPLRVVGPVYGRSAWPCAALAGAAARSEDAHMTIAVIGSRSNFSRRLPSAMANAAAASFKRGISRPRVDVRGLLLALAIRGASKGSISALKIQGVAGAEALIRGHIGLACRPKRGR